MAALNTSMMPESKGVIISQTRRSVVVLQVTHIINGGQWQ